MAIKLKGYVLCFQPISELKNVKTPFVGKIQGEIGTHWLLSAQETQFKAHKAACSTTIFETKKKAEQFQAQVRKTSRGEVRKGSKEIKQAVMETPETDDSSVPENQDNLRHERPRNRKNQRSSGSVRDTKKSRWKSSSSASSKDSLGTRVAGGRG